MSTIHSLMQESIPKWEEECFEREKLYPELSKKQGTGKMAS